MELVPLILLWLFSTRSLISWIICTNAYFILCILGWELMYLGTGFVVIDFKCGYKFLSFFIKRVCFHKPIIVLVLIIYFCDWFVPDIWTFTSLDLASILELYGDPPQKSTILNKIEVLPMRSNSLECVDCYRRFIFFTRREMKNRIVSLNTII